MWTTFSNQPIKLEPDHVHIWYVNKVEGRKRLAEYWEVLNELERARAWKYRFESDRSCFITARGVLRKLLGLYLNKAPNAINFHFGEYGKPSLSGESNIEFNVSHSGDAIVLGFVRENCIGIDVEGTKRDIEALKIAKHFFSEEEQRSLSSLNKEYHNQGFYNCWTRKEAFIKALGSGLSFPLDQFVVSLDCRKEAKLLKTKWDTSEKDNWILESFEPCENYIGAVTVKGKVNQIEYWRYR